MRPINAIFVSAACLTLGACAITVTDDGINRSGHNSDTDFVSVKLPSGARGTISCPQEMEVFVVNRTSEGRGLVYGCRTDDARVPTLD